MFSVPSRYTWEFFCISEASCLKTWTKSLPPIPSNNSTVSLYAASLKLPSALYSSLILTFSKTVFRCPVAFSYISWLALWAASTRSCSMSRSFFILSVISFASLAFSSSSVDLLYWSWRIFLSYCNIPVSRVYLESLLLMSWSLRSVICSIVSA